MDTHIWLKLAVLAEELILFSPELSAETFSICINNQPPSFMIYQT